MDSPRRPDFSALIAQLATALNGHAIPFMLIGRQAVFVHGEPRLKPRLGSLSLEATNAASL